ncbi:hypothetical protein BKI52_00730 [marine bacterium AO1-C]|nr:hypothetical protein BKI52_00730 [marine bacterium AO1-C]
MAQYVPPKKRKPKNSTNQEKGKTTISKNTINQFYNIRLKKERVLTIIKPVVFCDTLIMEDESIIKISPTLKSFTLYAKHVQIGKNCLITSKGKDGTETTFRSRNGEWGANAIPINLYLNFYALKNLTIDARGGNGGEGQVPGIYGAGGNIKLLYYAPFAVSFRKPRRKRKQQATIVFKHKKGKMDLQSLNTLNAPEKFEDLNAVDPRRTVRVYNPKTRTFYIVENVGGSVDKLKGSETQDKTSARIAEDARSKRKDGELTFKRMQEPIQVSAVKKQ